MKKFSRLEFLNCLNNNWQFYTSRYLALSLNEKSLFLEKQGYPTLNGLFGHIISWWQEAVITITKMQNEPAYLNPEYDVDDFNARAIKNFSHFKEAEILQLYESQRKKMVNLINNLSDNELDSENINTRLYYEIIEHWDEHAIEEA